MTAEELKGASRDAHGETRVGFRDTASGRTMIGFANPDNIVDDAWRSGEPWVDVHWQNGHFTRRTTFMDLASLSIL